MPHPVTIDQKTVNEIHNGQDDKQLPEARRKAARTVYPIDTDQHIADIAGDTDGFEQQAVASDAFRACKPQFYAPLLHRRAVKMLRLPISSTAKVMYARMLDIVFLSGIEDANGILFIHFPIVELAAALARSTMTVKRSLNELEDAGLILRVRQGFGEPNKIYVLIPKKEDSRL